MRVFVDTTALYALVDDTDRHHEPAVRWIDGPGRDRTTSLLTHSYVVVEASALVHRMLGAEVARLLHEAVETITSVLYVDEPLHRVATRAYLAPGTRRASLVDAVSFEMMRDQQIDRAFAFDRDFAAAGFAVVP